MHFLRDVLLDLALSSLIQPPSSLSRAPAWPIREQEVLQVASQARGPEEPAIPRILPLAEPRRSNPQLNGSLMCRNHHTDIYIYISLYIHIYISYIYIYISSIYVLNVLYMHILILFILSYGLYLSFCVLKPFQLASEWPKEVVEHDVHVRSAPVVQGLLLIAMSTSSAHDRVQTWYNTLRKQSNNPRYTRRPLRESIIRVGERYT